MLVLFFCIRGCLNARKERAFEDYVADVSALSRSRTSRASGLFAAPGGATAATSPVEVQNTVNGFRARPRSSWTARAASEHPDELDYAQAYLVEALEFRRDGMAGIAEPAPSALGEEGRGDAAGQIAGSDAELPHERRDLPQRVLPRPRGAAPERGPPRRGRRRCPQSRFLPDIDWLQPRSV